MNQQRKTILYVGGFILPDGNAAAHRVLSNAKIFRNLGYEVTFLGITKKNHSKDVLASRKNHQGFNSFEVCYPNTKIEWVRYLSSIKDLKKIALLLGLDNIHSIIVYNYPSLSLLKVINFCKKHQIKLIADCTEWYMIEKEFGLFRYLKNFDNFWRMKYLHYKCDGIISISKFLYNFYKNNINTILIPPLIDLKETKWFAQFPSLDSIKEFTFVGSPSRLGEKESFSNILLAFSSLSKDYDFLFTIVGITEAEIIKESIKSKQLIEELGQKIKFWGRIENRECISLVNKSHFFIFFRNNTITTRAGFPTKYVESISSGTPVLTNETSDLKDYMIAGKNGFWIDEYNMVSQLEYCLKMPIESILEMKEYCISSKEFEYTNYLEEMSYFLNKL